MAEEKKGFFRRLAEGLTKTRDNIVSGMDAIFNGFSDIDDDFYDEKVYRFHHQLYGLLLMELDQAAVKGVKTSPYGVEALVRRDGVPAGMQVSPVSIEELFIFMVKEAA